VTILSPEIKLSLQRYLEGDLGTEGGEQIHTRCGNRGGLLRLSLKSGGSIVIKIWRFRNIKERIKFAVHLSNGRREWRMHRLLYNAGIPTPQPLWFHSLDVANGQIYEAMAIEDLGATERGLTRLKKLVVTEDENAVISLEDRLILITVKFIQLGVLDVDHQLNNFLVDADGHLFRIDFECARQRYLTTLRKQEYSEMIARLLASHIYAVQPDVIRSVYFAERLYNNLNFDHQLQIMVRKSVDSKLERQRRENGVVTVVKLP
jgi:hypothetical protein